MKAVMSIKPRYVEMIREGKKKYEFRKKRLQENVTQIIMYSTKPQGKIVGWIRIDKQLSGSPSKLWSVTKDEAGITEDEFFEYYSESKKAYAYRICEVTIFPMQLEPFENFTIPQSIRYFKPWEEDILSWLEQSQEAITS